MLQTVRFFLINNTPHFSKFNREVSNYLTKIFKFDPLITFCMIKGTLLIADRNKSDQNALKQILQHEVEKIIAITDPNRIYEILEREQVDIVLLEMNFHADINSGNEGLFWMKEIFRAF